MLYLIKSFGRDGKSILKIGYTDDLNRRMSQYFYNNPCFELITTREGDELLEDMIQVYLKSLGYQYQKNGKLNEWFIDTPEIYQIFHIHRENLERVIWRYREKILKLNISCELMIYEYLRGKYISEIKENKYKVINNSIIKLKYNRLDVEYNESHPLNINLENITNEIVYKFIQTFLSTNKFANKMKLVCEFLDNNIDLKDSIINLIDKKYIDYYNFLGTAGCRAKKYQEDLILNEIKFELRKDIIFNEICSNFLLGDKLNKKEIKKRIRIIYKKLGIKSTAKAIDILNWFEVKEIRIATVEGKRDHGFEIIALKK